MISFPFMRPGRPTRHLVLATVVAASLCPLIGQAGPPDQAESFIRKIGDRAVAILNARERDVAARRNEMAALLDEAVDVERMARLVLGRHWRSLTEAQRTEYVGLFRAYLLSGLSTRLGGVGGERIVVKGSRPAPHEEDSMVGTQVVLEPGQPPVDVEWRVRQEGNRYRIVDVVAEDVSLVVTNRAEFDAIIARQGIDGLLEQMRRWRDEAAGHRS